MRYLPAPRFGVRWRLLATRPRQAAVEAGNVAGVGGEVALLLDSRVIARRSATAQPIAVSPVIVAEL